MKTLWKIAKIFCLLAGVGAVYLVFMANAGAQYIVATLTLFAVAWMCDFMERHS